VLGLPGEVSRPDPRPATAYLNSSVGDRDGDDVDELDGEDIEGVESSLPPVDKCCAVTQAGINVAPLYGEPIRDGGNELVLGNEGDVESAEAAPSFGLRVPGGINSILEVSDGGLSKYPLW